ncbi:MAG TPA: hypothetical protein VIY69_03850, partial [Candidatus Acidoferrales bacterium]
HLPRRKQEGPANVRAADSRQPGGSPQSHAEIRLPRLSAELAPLDLKRLLAPQILRLFVGQDFLWISLRLDYS